MTIEPVTEPSDELVEAFARLMPQLSPDRQGPGATELADVIAAPGTVLLVARDGGQIVGTLTLLVFHVPTGVRAWIHDVVVDEAARGRGVGEALTREAMRLAAAAGADSVHLTTRPQREAANRLYRRLGFAAHDTNVYVWRPD